MANTLETIRNVLGIDKIDMDSKMVLIKEQHGTNANFLMNAILFDALKKGNAVCLVLCHNTFGHYHNVGMRLGYNLLDLKEKGQITIVELMKIVADDVISISRNSNNTEKRNMDAIFAESLDIVHKLFAHVKNKYNKATEFNASVVLAIDDMSHFLDLGLGVIDVMYFMRYLRSFLEPYRTSQLCILMHTYQEDSQILSADMVAESLKHMAHLCVTTEPLRMGHSKDVSGKLTICWTNNIRSKYTYYWGEKTTYLFKLSDWQIKIYTPDEASVLL